MRFHPAHSSCLDGDIKALRPALLRIARRSLRKEDAEDAVQTAVLSGLQQIERFDPASGQAGLFAWLRLHLRRAVADHVRRMESRREEPMPEGWDEIPDPLCAESLQSQAQHAELLRRLDRVILTPRQAAMIRARLAGQAYTVIAASWGISYQAVIYHVQQGCRRLQQAGDLEVSEYAELLFAQMTRVSIYHRPTGVIDRRGNAEQIEARRYRNLTERPLSAAERRRRA